MRKLKKHLRVGLLLATLSLATTACESSRQQTPITETTIKPDCVNWKTLSYSAKSDSAETVREIIASNAARKAACG